MKGPFLSEGRGLKQGDAMNTTPVIQIDRKSSRFLKLGRIQFSKEAERRLFFFLTLAMLLMGLLELLLSRFS
jgi:hypothetical protein